MTRLKVALFAFALILAGCDMGENSDAAEDFDRQLALDKGDYPRVLELTKNCFSDECLMDRAAAYMGLAGFSVPSILTAVVNNEKSGKKFFTALESEIAPNADNLLNQAETEYFKTLRLASLGADNVNAKAYCVSAANLGKYQKDSCANAGLVAIAKSASLAKDLQNCAPSTACEAKVKKFLELLFDDTELLLSIVHKDDAKTKQKVEEIKGEICAAAGERANCAATDLVSGYQDILDKYIKKP
ncbi:MAG: hypothetical protein LBU73_06165 [Helicobacteraceae bacterium]|jgi:hypothetical protein|nr:hypothetical protein [Helicobacteraceae bacterium]